MTLPPRSILDLAPVAEGADFSSTYARSVSLAQHAEKWGYKRFWLAEHHNMPDIASAATSVLLSHIGAHTSSIRLGSGGVMLPNHAPLVIAEQFGTLEALYPNRIDLGLGRAPGTDYPTMHALRRDPERMDPNFDELLEELQFFMGPVSPNQPVKAYPGSDSSVPIWLLGSSTYSARLAGIKGLPFAFASHFAPDAMMNAIQIYREHFQPSEQLDKPYVMIGVNIIVADTDDEAQYLGTTEKQKFLNMTRGVQGKIPPPVWSMESVWLPHEKYQIEKQLRESIHGDQDTVRTRLIELTERTQADEIMANALIFDHEKKLRSYELLAGL
ncbi:LLM class flavin-dependent oxidoreductase [Photobacterium sp. WH77]|uniref:LLM class flavin-dependent oxidoreductase n=1 Tax=unclassified Photobacterium TaxID=2628852 RepID=UPI001EDB9DF1|nr:MULTISPECIES: LLM class flavin-dependent oxidoreductase [unclassified Photobacterium]MCG2836078.1 LLM class flavin-dependent oxidoreductase [Photobacterium sp. WH77]MCG2843785.1 LLM class flavin-dependent oxidoreductase [Photobacterium sp. WH80]MDO6583629.1 LLM class flavin-dependent oxidoreductase [Photobacterium sp. 2_MG-2023]